MKTISANGYNATSVGVQNVRIFWDGSKDTVSTTTILSLGLLPANAVVKSARGTLVTAEGAAGNLLLAWRQDAGSTTTLLTVNANGTAGTRTNAPTNIDGTAAINTAGALLDTTTYSNYELVLLGSAALDTAVAVIDLEVYFGPSIGADGTATIL